MNESLIATVAEAIASAEVGYSISLTRLVDGVSEYTLTYHDGSAPLTFEENADAYEHVRARIHRARAEAAISAYSAAVAGKSAPEWQPMDTAPLDGKHCLLAVKEGAFVYTVQGAYHAGEWNAVHRGNVKPLCWMPNVPVPEEFLPYRNTAVALEGAHD
jgi:hypothetical protein